MSLTTKFVNGNKKTALASNVVDILSQGGQQMPTSVAKNEVDWFFNNMGIDEYYFVSQAPKTIADHVKTLYAWKFLHATELESNKSASVKFGFERRDHAMFAVRSFVEIDSTHTPESPTGVLEQLIEGRYFLEGYRNNVYLGKYQDEPFRMQCYNTQGTISPFSKQLLRFYFLTRPNFPKGDLAEGETDIDLIGDLEFVERASANTKFIYQDMLAAAINRDCNTGPVFKVFKSQSQSPQEEARLVVCYKHGTTHSFFSSLTTLYDKAGLYARKKAVEQFKNGWVILSVHLRALGDTGNTQETTKGRMVGVWNRAEKVARDAAMSFVLPRTSLAPLLYRGLGVHEHAYAYCAWKFAFHFLNRYEEEYRSLRKTLETRPEALQHLLALKASLRAGSFSEGKLREVFCLDHILPVVKELYNSFKNRHDPRTAQPGQVDEAQTKRLKGMINTACRTKIEWEVMMACLNFNTHLLKTNFFKRGKLALSFRLDPNFLSKNDFPATPFAIFFMVGAEFRGFHIRFTDIARGGLRLIKSRSPEAYVKNAQGVFEENYNLALTQQKKNKDIPEGGSKGTILLSLDHQNKDAIAFHKYIDALLDVILVDKNDVVDHFGAPEIIFCGPDENTANFMDSAAYHARARGFKYWRAFTTGKSISMGGIPHDMFGMTTRSVHQYVLGVLEKQGLKESEVTKFQTGGPDGDLGSNEILISHDRTVAVVDGSGVLVDSQGIDRSELEKLAKNRQMVEHIDKSKLSSTGMLVKLDARNMSLPDGTAVTNGVDFRNNFHLDPRSSADVFVPCGGRPGSINIHNYTKLLDASGACRFPIIVEGANLFLTQDARLKLEEAGAILYKDASANKGGVTSSSCEVLACLALSEGEHKQHMQVPGNDPSKIPAFYTQYVKAIHSVIENNARNEFEVIWREHEKTGTPRCVLTDLVSSKINTLNVKLTGSSLWDDAELRKKAVESACPKVLVDLIGVDTLMNRVPLAYVKAIFGATLASRYVYEFGLDASEFEFFAFINNFLKKGTSKL